jgi:hypothetical protein
MPMEAANPFAQVPTTPEPIIALVRRQLADEEEELGIRVPLRVVDRAADRAVRELWGSRVKTFVPILALRQAREILRDQDVVLATQWPERRHAEGTRTAGRPQSERSPGDRIPVEGDALPHDEGDVLSF